MSYFIKHIWGPGGQMNYKGDQTEFSENYLNLANRFSDCKGFLLYETGSKEGDKVGSKKIFAQGKVKSEVKYKNFWCRGINFPHFVEIKLNKRVYPHNGISLDDIREILKIKMILRRGGLLEITEEQFDILSKKLDDCISKESSIWKSSKNIFELIQRYFLKIKSFFIAVLIKIKKQI